MLVDDGARIATVFGVRPFGAAAVALDVAPPAQRVSTTLRSKALVALQPAEAAVVGGERHRPALAIVGSADALIEVVVIGDQRADRPARIKGITDGERLRIGRLNPRLGVRRKLGETAGKAGACALAPQTLLMDLPGHDRHGGINAPHGASLTDELALVGAGAGLPVIGGGRPLATDRRDDKREEL